MVKDLSFAAPMRLASRLPDRLEAGVAASRVVGDAAGSISPYGAQRDDIRYP